MKVFDILQERGFIAQTTHEDKIKDLLNNNKIKFYTGYDPTADSLHVGHLLQLIVMSHMQKAGHTPIAIIGGGTTMVGDPTGKTDMRKMLSKEQINSNAECFKKQMSTLVDFTNENAIMINNYDWLSKLNYIEFLREIGVHFSVNRMLSAECFKSRLEKGLSFIEFNYMLMQSYDFLKLFQDYNCVLQLGGDDQWSNIINGADLIRRVEKKEAYGMTFNLLTTSEGKKMGKTEKGAIWLDENKTSIFDFFQYWRNIADNDVIKCLKLMTFVEMDEINELAKLQGEKINSAKERLAFEITKIVHGEDKATKAKEAAKALFVNGTTNVNMPTIEIDKELINDEFNILKALVIAKISTSNSEARRSVLEGAISINGIKVKDIKMLITTELFTDLELIIKRGKKKYCKLVIK